MVIFTVNLADAISVKKGRYKIKHEEWSHKYILCQSHCAISLLQSR